jgi:predicted DNA-binding helix-hairpin-helix protein
MADFFYKKMNLRRVYYSGYVPISNDNRLPAIGTPVPMIRENRLYQADWLVRNYGFDVKEIVAPEHPILDLDIDPKIAWALRNYQTFPIDINKADRELVMRVPGIGVQSADKIISARKFNLLSWDHLKKIGISLNRARYFITCKGNDIMKKDLTPMQVRQQLLAIQTSKYQANFTTQLNLF